MSTVIINMNNIYIAYKTRYEYPATKSVVWAQKLEGPFSDATKVVETLSDLREVKRLGDVKDIKVLTEQHNDCG